MSGFSNNACDTLVRAAQQISILENQQKILFLNAAPHEELEHFQTKITCIQHLYNTSKTLLSKGYSVFKDIKDSKEQDFDAALILWPQNITSAHYITALALSYVKENSKIICAAANDAGGKRLKDIEKIFKIQNVSYISKNKAKAVIFENKNPDKNAVNKAMNSGKLQFLESINAYTQAGIYGWQKIDQGSKLLMESTTEECLQGNGADFGCGYGYLSIKALENDKNKIESLACIDLDARALEACTLSLKQLKNNTKIEIQFIWDDLTAPDNRPQNLDFILMNPPFHSGKNTDNAIGQSFIENAAKSLKTSGKLYMVANTHLPYEHTLEKCFKTHEVLAQKNGFKVIKALT